MKCSVYLVLLYAIVCCGCGAFSALEKGKRAYYKAEYEKAESLFRQKNTPESSRWLNDTSDAKEIVHQKQLADESHAKGEWKETCDHLANVLRYEKEKQFTEEKLNEQLSFIFKQSKRMYTENFSSLMDDLYRQHKYYALVVEFNSTESHGYLDEKSPQYAVIEEKRDISGKNIKRFKNEFRAAKAYCSEGNYQKAKGILEEHRLKYPEKSKEVREHLDKIEQYSQDKKKFNDWFDKAQIAYKEKRYEESNNSLNKALAIAQRDQELAQSLPMNQISALIEKNKAHIEFDNRIDSITKRINKGHFKDVNPMIANAKKMAANRKNVSLDVSRLDELKELVQENKAKEKEAYDRKLKGRSMTPRVIDFSESYKITASGEGNLKRGKEVQRWAEAKIEEDTFRKLYVKTAMDYSVNIYRDYLPKVQGEDLVDRRWTHKGNTYFISNFFQTGEFFIRLKNHRGEMHYKLDATLYHMVDR